LAVLLIGMTCAAPSEAAGDWHLAPFAGVKFGGTTTLRNLDLVAGDRKLVFGATATWIGRGIFGLEADLGIVPNYFTADESPKFSSSQVTTLMGNVVVAAPLGWTRDSLRPYVSGGAGLIRAAADDTINLFSYRRNLGGYNVGGGVVGFVTPFTGVKWDLRYFKGWGSGDVTTLGSARLSFWRGTMSLVLKY
jgi:hypothetical protein